MIISIIKRSKHSLPGYSTVLSAGKDIRENLAKDFIIKPLKGKLIGRGLCLEILLGYEAQIHPGRRPAISKGFTVLN